MGMGMGCGVPVFDLVLAQDADELSAEAALRGRRSSFHEEHHGSK